MQKLRPFNLDSVLRAGSRLQNVDVDVKHSIILSQTSHFTKLIIRQYQATVGHSGTDHTWSEVQQRVWIIKDDAVVRNSTGKCVLCKKRCSTARKQLKLSLQLPGFIFINLHFLGWDRLILRVSNKTKTQFSAAVWLRFYLQHALLQKQYKLKQHILFQLIHLFVH